jgi:hypothetical protein
VLRQLSSNPFGVDVDRTLNRSALSLTHKQSPSATLEPVLLLGASKQFTLPAALAAPNKDSDLFGASSVRDDPELALTRELLGRVAVGAADFFHH